MEPLLQGERGRGEQRRVEESREGQRAITSVWLRATKPNKLPRLPVIHNRVKVRSGQRSYLARWVYDLVFTSQPPVLTPSQTSNYHAPLTPSLSSKYPSHTPPLSLFFHLFVDSIVNYDTRYHLFAVFLTSLLEKYRSRGQQYRCLSLSWQLNFPSFFYLLLFYVHKSLAV